MRVVSLEGIDGAGKSVLVEYLEKNMKVEGIEVVSFPSSHFYERYYKGMRGPVVEMIQQEDKKYMYDKHVKKGTKVLLCDRAEVSQMVYNGTEKTSIKSDKVIYLDIEVDKALDRVNERGIEDPLDFEKREVLEDKKKEYERILKSKEYRDKVEWVKVDGDGYRDSQ